MRRTAGFTLTELAVVMVIVGFLMGSLMYTFSAQIEQRNYDETRRRLDQARELLLAYAIVNGRLPCPARSTSSGLEQRDSATGQCTSGGVEDYYGGTLTSGAIGGLLPAATIGFQQTDPSGFALDAFNNRIRYAVSKTIDSTTCTVSATYHFTNATSLRTNGIACQPRDLQICKTSVGSPTSLLATAGSERCGGTSGDNALITSGLVAALVFSTGKNANASTGGSGADEQTNLKTNTSLSPLINAIFVYHPPTSSDYVYGEFDDQFTWITPGELYGKLISAGVLP
jgi:prepilin-type N-terminal cleavage/methylation domain-containing protein